MDEDERREKGDRLDGLLSPYISRAIHPAGAVDPELGWWVCDVPPAIAEQAFGLLRDPDTARQRPNDQPPQGWLVTEAAKRPGSTLSGYVCPRGVLAPRLRWDGICIPADQSEKLAHQIEQWEHQVFESPGNALELALVEGWARADATESLWEAVGWEYLDRMGPDVAYVSFWWD